MARAATAALDSLEKGSVALAQIAKLMNRSIVGRRLTELREFDDESI